MILGKALALCCVVALFTEVQDVANPVFAGELVPVGRGMGIAKNVGVLNSPEHIESFSPFSYFSNFILTKETLGFNVKNESAVWRSSEPFNIRRLFGENPIEGFSHLNANRSKPSGYVNSGGFAYIFDGERGDVLVICCQLEGVSVRNAQIRAKFQFRGVSGVFNDRIGGLGSSASSDGGPCCKENGEQQSGDLGNCDPELALGPIRLLLSRFCHAPLLAQIAVFAGLGLVAHTLCQIGGIRLFEARRRRDRFYGGSFLGCGLALWGFIFWFASLA